ncbi:MAG: adenosylcobalamin-dependent ribonucleoside-diphosphate reductase [Proteobacteria bacterium]|nr:adenosylcobalamin-dependent ribonucleoside-diphosphate reductase [Pseudomonadota bacterium]
MTYTRDEAYKASLKYFNGDELAASVFCDKYALRNPGGGLLELTPSDMHRRLAREFARIEAKYPNPLSEKEIFCLLADVEHIDISQRAAMSIEELAKESRGLGPVVPQGSPMSAIGNEFQYQSLSNCFVIQSPYDSYAGILKADQEQAQIMKRRGGVGFDISTIRPKGIVTANAARTTDGIGVFMERFSNTCREVAQGGRRGALMLTIDVHHPEIRTFVNIKRDLKKVTGANISIRLTDEFMQAVKDGSKVQLRFPVEKDAKHSVEEMVDAKQLWHEIIEAAWASAEPGLLFWDTVKRMTPTEAYASVGYGSTSTNPCGEIVLSPYDSCRLLLVNLYKFVKNPFTSAAAYDNEKFKDVVVKAQRLMDDLIDLEIEAVDKIISKIKNDPEPEEVKQSELNLWKKIKEAALGGRRTGLGITALGDTLAAMGFVYGSKHSIQMTESLYKSLAVSSYRSTITMAEERGAFPVFSHKLEAEHPFIKQILEANPELVKDYKKHGRRNIAITTTAPAGSVSVLTQTTSGIEPAFMLFYKRRKKVNGDDPSARVDFIDPLGDKWQEYTVYHHAFKKWMEVNHKTEENVTESPYHGGTANEIDWVAKVDLQAAAQKWICHSISNTTNIPNSTSVDVVKDIYMRGWETGCKGVTIYRDGCRTGVLVAETSKVETKNVDGQPETLVESHAPKRPKELTCDIHRINVRSGSDNESYLVLVGKLEDKPYEIFCGLSQHVEVPKKAKTGTLIKNGKKDGVATYNLQIPIGDDDHLLFKDVVELFSNPNHGAMTRTLSLALRHGVPVQYVVEQLQKDKHSGLQSFSKAIARVLKTYIPDGTKSQSDKICGSCGLEGIVYKEGCATCNSCGWSKCG